MKSKCIFCLKKEDNHGFFCGFECERNHNKQLQERLKEIEGNVDGGKE